jgi:hypothetical protein
MDARLHRRDLPEAPISPTFAHTAKYAYEKRDPEHFEDLEARWHNPLRSKKFKNFLHEVTQNPLLTAGV